MSKNIIIYKYIDKLIDIISNHDFPGFVINSYNAVYI